MKYLSSTSRNLDPANYAWESVVHQFGRPLLDSELNLSQDILRNRLDVPSGIISNQSSVNDVGQYVFYPPYTGEPKVLNPDFRANTLTIQRFVASVNGMVVDVKGTNSTDTTLNHVELSDPEESGRLVDFVFLEVWRKEVTPSMSARARLKISSPLPNETLTFQDINNNSVVLTSDVDYTLTNSSPETARNLSEAINNYDGQGAGLTVGAVTVTSETRGTPYLFLTLSGGSAANVPNFNIVSSSPAVLVVTHPSGGSDGEGKPNANSVYYSGNLDCHSSLYLSDDIQDPTLNVSSSRRIQIQYRLRVHQNFNYNISQDIFGLDSFALYAQGANANPINNVTFSRHTEDVGLWVAGDGSEASASSLGTVDGYIYAIPIAFVYRRNKPLNVNEGFHPLDRYNTGALHDHDGNTLDNNPYVGNVGATFSDRPDGLFSDQIASEDVLDLRRRVFPRGLDFSSELVYQYHSLLDGLNKTWIAEAHNLADTGNGTAGISHTPLMCDVFGSSANTLNIGNHKVDFNNVSRRFTNAPIVERFFVPVYAGANPDGIFYTKNNNAQQSGWHTGDTIVISLATLDRQGDPDWQVVNNLINGINLPQGSKITDIGMCWHNDGHYVNPIPQDVEFSSVNIQSNSVSFVLGENDLVANGGLLAGADYALVSNDSATAGSNEVIFIEIIVEIASGDYGLTGIVEEEANFDEEVYPTGSCVSINEPQGVVNLYPNTGNTLASPIINMRAGKREVSLEYVRDLMTKTFVTSSSDYTYIPYRVYGDDSTISISDISDPVNPNVLTLDPNSSKFSHSEAYVAWQNGWVTGQRAIEMEFHPVVPFHGTDTTNNSIFVFYKRPAPQTCGSDFPIANDNVSTSTGGVVPVELELSPLAIGDKISSFMNSDLTYPFNAPTEHLGSSPLAESNYGYNEYVVLNSNEVFLDDLTVNTGSVDLSTLVPMASSVKITLGNGNVPPVKDNYNRVVYQAMGLESYNPASYAKNLSVFNKGYKNALPCLMKVTTDDHDLYRKGEVLLVVFVKTSTWGQSVSVDMRDNNANNLVVACVYRTHNLLLLGD